MPCPYHARGARRDGRIVHRDGRRAHRAGGVPHRGSGRWRRSLVGTRPGGEEPHAGAAVTPEATLIACDGIGREITQATLHALGALWAQIGCDGEDGAVRAIARAGTPLPNSTPG